MDNASVAALWWAVIASGLYHGLNPGMGWPLAVSSALMDRRYGHLYKALLALGVGHLLSMTAILLPFSAMLALADCNDLKISARTVWEKQIHLWVIAQTTPCAPKHRGFSVNSD